MSRRVLAGFIVACAIAGAVVNAGVAWVCVWGAEPASAAGPSVPGAWPAGTPGPWGKTAACSYVDVQFGVRTWVYFDSDGESVRGCGSNGTSETWDETRRQAEVVLAGWPLAAMESLRKYEYQEHSEGFSGFDDSGKWVNTSSSKHHGGCLNAGTGEGGWGVKGSRAEGDAGLTYPLMPRPVGFIVNTAFWAAMVALGVGFARYGSVPRWLGGSGGRRVRGVGGVAA